MRTQVFILAILVMFFDVYYSQTLTQEQIDSTIASLSSDNPLILLLATKVISEHNLYEAIPVLESGFHEKNVNDQIHFLGALVNLQAENSHAFVKSYIEKLENYKPKEPELYEKEELKLRAINLLFILEDYSYSDFVFGKVADTTHNNQYVIVNMLYLLLDNSEEYELQAKNELINGVRNGKEIRALSLDILVDKYGTEMIPLMIERFKEDDDFSIRLSILDDEFLKYESNLINDALKERLSSDPSDLIRSRIARYLLVELGTISNYKYAIDWLKYSDDSDSELKKRIKLELEYVYPKSPPLPDSTVGIETMLDTLISYTNQCYELKWITSKGTYNGLSEKLDDAKKELDKEKDDKAKNKLVDFRNEVEKQLGKKITEEGYRFLYYYSEYIIEQLRK